MNTIRYNNNQESQIYYDDLNRYRVINNQLEAEIRGLGLVILNKINSTEITQDWLNTHTAEEFHELWDKTPETDKDIDSIYRKGERQIDDRFTGDESFYLKCLYIETIKLTDKYDDIQNFLPKYEELTNTGRTAQELMYEVFKGC